MTSGRVLIVDDEPFVVRALQRLLQRERFEVETADSAEQALERLERFAADAVISDYRMPGQTGRQLLAQVAASRPGVARLLLSGYTDAALGVCREAEVCLAKPWDDAELIGSLRRLLDRRGVDPSGAGH
jgi:DNA-binding NtrC family response regulator